MKTAFLLVCLFAVGGLALTAEKPTRDQEGGAVGVMRSINTAEMYYARTYQDRGFACTLATLGEGPEKDKRDADHAGLISADVVSGKRDGYVFTLTCTDQKTPHNRYASAAAPQSGEGRAFCSDQSGVIRSADDGSAETCRNSGTALQ